MYSFPILSFTQNWGHLVTERFLENCDMVLDMGCGAGEHQSFGRNKRKYIALDIDLDVIKIGRENHYNNLAVQGDACNLPFGDGKFDGVVSVYCLEHLKSLDKSIAEIYRVLKPGGVLALSIPTEGLLFRLGRRLVTAPFAKRKLGFKTIKAYEDYVAEHHINSVEDVFAAINKRFDSVRTLFFPFNKLGKDLNLLAAFKGVKPLVNDL